MNTTSIVKFYRKYGFLIISLIIFTIILFTLGIPFHNWGFGCDDVGLIYNASIKSIKTLFCEDIGSYIGSSNTPPAPKSFFSAYYRPITCILLKIQHYFFKTKPYGYMFFTCFGHASNTVLFMYLLKLLNFSLLATTCSGLIFAFHPSLDNWMGWIAAQSYTNGLLFLLCSLIFLVLFLQKSKKINLLTSYLFFTLSIFCFEIVFFFPLTISFFLLFYEQLLYQKKINLANFFKKYGFVIFGYCMVNLVFITIRAYSYPLGSAKNISTFIIGNFLAHLKNRYADIASFLTEFFYLSLFIKPHNFYGKFFLLLTLLISLLYLFFRSKYKQQIILIILAALSLMWPIFIKEYLSRYIYYAIPFFIMALIFLIKKITLHKKAKTNLVLCLLLIIFLSKNKISQGMKWYEQNSHKLMVACNQLLQNKEIQNKPICFVGLSRIFSNFPLAQYLWLNNINRNLPIYWDQETFITDHWGQKGLFITKKTDYKINITCDKNKYSFLGALYNFPTSTGKKTFTEDNEKKYVNYIIDKKFYKQNLAFIAWDYEKEKFKNL
jgi:hypothetical protein